MSSFPVAVKNWLVARTTLHPVLDLEPDEVEAVLSPAFRCARSCSARRSQVDDDGTLLFLGGSTDSLTS
ncbi:hypothetical protein P4050_16530 [Pseudomonas aeruginosa]|nr:hypothetical protein [Pseudomonas aeruginosa]